MKQEEPDGLFQGALLAKIEKILEHFLTFFSHIENPFRPKSSKKSRKPRFFMHKKKKPNENIRLLGHLILRFAV